MKKITEVDVDEQPIVYVIDDDEAVLDAAGLLLRSIGINNATHSNAQFFIDSLRPDDFNKRNACILMDIRMPVMSGIECLYKLEALNCIWPVIFVTGHGDVATAVETMKHGAFDFIQKPYREQALIDAIQKALLKNKNELRHLNRINDTKEKLNNLTKRETQILESIIDGKANKVIAIELSLSQRTVEIHRAHVMEKMEVKSLAELIRTVLDTFD
jgi:two-component system response regulator FixJ